MTESGTTAFAFPTSRLDAKRTNADIGSASVTKQSFDGDPMAHPDILAALAAGKRVLLQPDLFDAWAATPVILEANRRRRKVRRASKLLEPQSTT